MEFILHVWTLRFFFYKAFNYCFFFLLAAVVSDCLDGPNLSMGYKVAGGIWKPDLSEKWSSIAAWARVELDGVANEWHR